ncbi:ComF family protein [Paracoccus saliphilus]|uniref:Predicted amidophosphoribosyltransferases n=2 Tax=Paracoccus saliphilus TaxID=405559 RepID=A0AA45W4V2_9RHOB|nr:double zinc ribbon domain-containing protein [Paracoccus saliphilus]SIS88365.1 Predicted amidophosphoribosyltransferases [Paracoccus saliphilus]
MGMEHKVLRRPIKAVLRMLYPSQCLACGQIVMSEGNDALPQRAATDLCPDCWQDTHFISGLACTRCGAPLPDDGIDYDQDVTCDDCLAFPRPWHDGRAAILYSGTGRKLVLTLKHGDRPDLAPALAGWLSVAAAPVIRPGMIVAPIPLHFRRLLKRRYNQSALLARHLAKAHGLPHIPDLLLRKRHTPAQDHRGVSDRFANISGAIMVNPRRISCISGKPVLLVDDVMTSGATLAAATEALLAAGSGPVFVTVLARAVKDD